MKELEALFERLKASVPEEDYGKLETLLNAYVNLTGLIEDERMTIRRLREMLFSRSTEKKSKVVGEVEGESPQRRGGESGTPSEGDEPDKSSKRRKGKSHGKNGADAYKGAERIRIARDELKHGQRCPECETGKVYAKKPKVLYNDDTGMKVLSLMNEPPEPGDGVGAERTGLFTSGIVSTKQGRRIALFFTGRKHAGENLSHVLAQRASELPPPIQMCDALSRNPPKEFETILANCLTHGRRNFVKVVENFPQECRYVIEVLAKVYRNDALARERELSPEQRLRFHQAKSEPILKKLKAWFKVQMDDKKVEPNSGLGEAIRYMLKHWEKLTRFLKVPGAPLDNNLCERSLKKAILHRKNSLFYKTKNGAQVGDIFLSLIHTAELNGIDPFHYLTELIRHRGEIAGRTVDWLPWNYRDTLARGSENDQTHARLKEIRP